MAVKKSSAESPRAIAAVDTLLAQGGLKPGSRATRGRNALPHLPARAGRARRAAKPSAPELLRVPGWNRYPWLLHGFTTRRGGVSTAYSGGTCGEWNLGHANADSRANVDRNRRTLLRELGARGASLVTLKQVHSGVVRHTAGRGDGILSNTPGELLAIQTADCVPVLLVDPRHRAVGAFHAGWRGTVKRIVERGTGAMMLRFGSRPDELLAAIGPSIGACCYTVGDEVIADFHSQFAYADELFQEVSESDEIKTKYPLLFLTARAPGHSNVGPQIHLDLWEANRRQLLDAGLRPENIWLARECTSCLTDKYFSYRAEHGFTGRMLSVVGMESSR